MSSYPDGEYDFRLRAVDNAGNPSWVSGYYFDHYKKDTTPPAAITSISIDPSSWTSNINPTLHYTNPNYETVTIQYCIDNSLYQGVLWHDLSASNVINLSAMADGTHSIKLRVKDVAGNFSAESQSITYKKDATAPSAPTNLSLSPSSWTNDTTPTISYSNPTDLSGIDHMEYIVDDSSTWTTLPSNKEPDLSSYADGTHTIKLRAVDMAGNPGMASDAITYYKDITTPSAPTGLSISPTIYSTEDTTPTITYTGPTDTSGINHIEYRLNNLAWTTLSGTDIDMSSYADGVYTIKLRAVDNAGNTGAESQTVTYFKDADNSTAPLMSISPEEWTNNAAPTLEWSYLSAPNGVVKAQIGIAIKDTPLSQVTFADVDTQYGIQQSLPSTPLTVAMSSYSDGEYDIWIRGVDADENPGTAGKALYQKDIMQLTAVAKDYTTLLRWNSTQNCTYDVYRKKSSDTAFNLMVSGITTSYWIDSQVIYGQAFDYQVVAKETGKADFNSRPITSIAVAQTDVFGMFGAKPYYTNVEFNTSSGTGNINIVSGNLYYNHTDFSQNILGMELTRFYNSLSAAKSSFGRGWDFSYNVNLFKECDANGAETAVVLKMEDGTIYHFEKSGSIYTKPVGTYLILESNAGVYTVTTKDKTVYAFDSMMRLSTITDSNNNCITLTYDTIRGNLASVRNNVADSTHGNDVMNFTYTFSTQSGEPDRIATVTDASGRVYNFEYDTQTLNLVTGYINYNQNIKYGEIYTYGTNGVMSTIKNPREKNTTIEYTSGKATTITNPANEAMTIAYNISSTTSTFRHAQTIYTYEAATKLLSSMQNAIGVVTNYNYDGNLNLASTSYQNTIYDVANNQLQTVDVTESFIYDSEGNLTQHTLPNGYSIYYLYNNSNGKPFGQPEYVIAPFDKNGTTVYYTRRYYTYDSHGNMLTSGQIYKGTYENGTFTQVGGAEGATLTCTYSTFGQQLTKIEIIGSVSNTTTYAYDYRNRLTRTTNNDNSYTEQSYDANGNIETSRDAKGNITQYTYDILGRQISASKADNTSTSTTYDQNGNIISSTDAKGQVTSYLFDDIDRCWKTIYPDSTPNVQSDNPFETVSFTVDSSGNMTTTSIAADGVATLVRTNAIGLNVYTENGDVKTFTLYDNAGKQVISCNNSGDVTEKLYDIQGQNIKTVTDPNSTSLLYTIPSSWGVSLSDTPKNQTDTYAYSLAGNVLHSNVNGDVLDNEYDLSSRVTNKVSTQVINGTTETIQSTSAYDLILNGLICSKSTDGLGHVKEYYYNTLGRLIKEIDQGDPNTPVNITTQYTYDDNGNMLTMTRNDNTTVSYTYNTNNKMTRKEYSSTHYVTYAYDNNGNLTTMTQVYDGVTTTCEYIYDEQNNKKEEKRNGKTIATYTFTNGKLTRINNGSSTNYAGVYDYKYSSNGDLEKIVFDNYISDKYSTVRQYYYDSTGKLDYSRNYVGINNNTTSYTTDDYVYDDTGDLSGIDSKWEITKDVNGKITEEILEGTPTITKDYTYDAFGRLASESVTIDGVTETISYLYDDVNNRTLMTSGSDHWDYVYNEFNQLTTILKNDAAETSYTYDNRGNQHMKTQGGVVTTYNYDLADRLISVQNTINGTTTTIASYAYEGSDRRISQTVGSNTTVYYYNGMTPLYTEDGTGNRIEEFISEPGGAIVACQHMGHYNPVGDYFGDFYFYNKDIRGSVMSTYHINGGVKEYTYDAYGNTAEVGSSTFVNSIAYDGAVYDGTTGLYYMNARYYDSQTGRFITMDSYVGNTDEPWPWHLYAYCDGDPVNCFDPSGHIKRYIKSGKQYEEGSDYTYCITDRWVQSKLTQSYYFYGDVINHLNMYVAGGGILGMPYASRFLKHALTRSGSDVYYFYPRDYIAQELQNNSIVLKASKAALQAAINNNKVRNDRISGYYYDKISFGSGDMYYAIHEAKMLIDAKLTSRSRNYNIWNIGVTLYDKYDFTLFYPDNSLGHFIYNYGRAAQLMGIIKTFDIYIYFPETYNISR